MKASTSGPSSITLVVCASLALVAGALPVFSACATDRFAATATTESAASSATPSATSSTPQRLSDAELDAIVASTEWPTDIASSKSEASASHHGDIPSAAAVRLFARLAIRAGLRSDPQEEFDWYCSTPRAGLSYARALPPHATGPTFASLARASWGGPVRIGHPEDELRARREGLRVLELAAAPVLARAASSR